MRQPHMAAAVTVVILSSLAGAAPAEAGLDKLHKQQSEAGRVCFVKHWHYKSSGAWPTKQQAVAAVTKSWTRFTRAEYGAHWANLDVAVDKQLDCSQAAGARGAVWSCNLKARPCRR